MSIDLSKFFNVSEEDIISLSSVEYLTPNILLKVTSNFGSLEELLAMTPKQLQERGLGPDIAKQITGRNTDVSKQVALMKRHNIRLITLNSPEYPSLLREINDPPLWLYVMGQLPAIETKTLTVVGTRKPSSYALSAMQTVLSSTLLENVTTISGLAYGIDRQAHQLSLAAGGKTVAVLAGGLNTIYPITHTQLAEQILQQGGAVISEYPPLSRPLPYRFPIRNRIIAGLSPLTLIVEAAIKSGTLTTAKAALDYNRDVAAIPGDITRPNAAGANLLIGRGAMVITGESDLEQYYGLTSSKKAALIDKRLEKILNLLSAEPKTVDQLLEKTSLGIADILTQLTELELLGLVYQVTAGCYAAKKN